MSASVLFDSPGPRTRARHRGYTVLTVLVIVAILAYAAIRLGQHGQFEYSKWEPFVTPKYIEAIVFKGILVTLQLALFSVLFAVVFGVVFGIGKLSEHAWVRWPCWAVVEFFRAVPVLLLMVLIFFMWGISRGDFGEFWTVVAALTLYNGAVLAEVFRAGILAVPKGQGEAAYAIGMRKSQVMSIVLLPQAAKIMLPAILSQCVVALKDTSLGYVVTAGGLSTVAKEIYNGRFSNHVPTILVIGAIYVLLNLILTMLATLAQKKLVGEKKVLDVPMVGAAEAKV
ncbi:MAG TPA: amino acid ABC transporter permease [Nocardioides sp.]